MVGTQFGHKVCGILGSVHGQLFGDHKQGARKLRNSQLLSGALKMTDFQDDKYWLSHAVLNVIVRF